MKCHLLVHEGLLQMSKAKTVDLTSGPILKTLAELALPIMISSMLGTAYSIMDMAWIGLLGAKAVAGVGVGGMYVWLSQGLASLSRMGGQVNTAQACGRKDYDQARSYAAGSLQLTALSGILFAAVCVIFIQPLLGFFNLTDAETYTAAKSYTLITCGLILFSYLNLTLTGLSTAQGDSRTPLLANFIGLAGNMILDPLLILGIGPFQAGGCRSRYCDSQFTDSGFCSDGSAYPAFQTGAKCFTTSESAVCFSKRIL